MKPFFNSSILFLALIVNSTSLSFHSSALSFHQLFTFLTVVLTSAFNSTVFSFHSLVFSFHFCLISLAFCFASTFNFATFSFQSDVTSFHFCLIFSFVSFILVLSSATASSVLSLSLSQSSFNLFAKSFALVASVAVTFIIGVFNNLISSTKQSQTSLATFPQSAFFIASTIPSKIPFAKSQHP